MIELTPEQAQSLERAETRPTRVVNPRTCETFVLLPLEEYQRLLQDDYDDSPWTAEERGALEWEAGKHAGWEDMDDYDNYPDKQRTVGM